MLNNLISYKKVGGLRFVRIGRLQVSFCLVKAKAMAKAKAPARLPSYDHAARASRIATDKLLPIYGYSLNLCAQSRAHWLNEYNRALNA
jgi:hypothetical protein